MATVKKGAKPAPKTKDELVEMYTGIIAEKEKEIASLERPQFVTHCSFKYNESSSSVNLHTVKDVRRLNEILAWLIGQAKHFEEACSLTGTTDMEFKHQGHTLHQWASDISTEIGKIQISEKKEKLKNLKAKAEALESQEAKEAKALAAIEKELSEL
jgi:hypothetical protein